MIAYTFLVVLSVGIALMALVFGITEAVWVDKRVQFNHRKQTRIRIVLGAAVFGIAQLFDPQWEGFMLVPAMPAAFAILHRLTMNIARSNPHVTWYYLGPHIRGPKESEYDTFWWERAATGKVVSTKFSQGQPGWSVAYAVPRKWLPFLYCTLFETLILCLSTAGYFIL